MTLNTCGWETPDLSIEPFQVGVEARKTRPASSYPSPFGKRFRFPFVAHSSNFLGCHGDDTVSESFCRESRSYFSVLRWTQNSSEFTEHCVPALTRHRMDTWCFKCPRRPLFYSGQVVQISLTSVSVDLLDPQYLQSKESFCLQLSYKKL